MKFNIPFKNKRKLFEIVRDNKFLSISDFKDYVAFATNEKIKAEVVEVGNVSPGSRFYPLFKFINNGKDVGLFYLNSTELKHPNDLYDAIVDMTESPDLTNMLVLSYVYNSKTSKFDTLYKKVDPQAAIPALNKINKEENDFDFEQRMGRGNYLVDKNNYENGVRSALKSVEF